ncbi:MAG: nucleotidyl transferase AbiEii/AbiGii toxin family protein [Planctomycetota bacterium]
MFEELLIKIAQSLTAHHIPYMIIGGQAVLRYGTPRLTKDIDITLGVNTDRLGQIIHIINHLQLKQLRSDTEEFVKKTMVLPVQDETSGIRIDFIFSFTPYEQQAIQKAESVRLKNIEIKFATVEDLIIHKIFSGRPRDIEDIKSVILKHPDFDQTYVQKWLTEFDRTSETPSFLKTFQEIVKMLIP